MGVHRGDLRGERCDGDMDRPGAAGTCTITCTVSDGKAKATATEDVDVVVELPPNHAPAITGLTADPGTVQVGGDSQISCTAEDQDGDALSYDWTCTAGTFAGDGATVTWTAPDTAGTCTITCTVSDGKAKATATEDVDVVVELPPNHAPEIASLTADPADVSPGQDSTLTCTASDPDGNELTYAWTATGGEIDGSGETVTWSSDAVGTYTVTCQVDDGDLQRDRTVTITVTQTQIIITGTDCREVQ